MSALESVTCPSCGSPVPVGDRKCDNCGTRQKDFAPSPISYNRPETAEVPRPPAPASATPPPPPRPVTPAMTTPPPPARTYPAGSHARGIPSSTTPYAGPSPFGPVKPGADAGVPGRSRASSLALTFALIPMGLNLLGAVLIWVIVALSNDPDLTDVAFFGLGIAVFLVFAGLIGLVLFVLAVVFGVIGMRQTLEHGTTGRWRAVLAFAIVAWHVLLLGGFVAFWIVATS